MYLVCRLLLEKKKISRYFKFFNHIKDFVLIFILILFYQNQHICLPSGILLHYLYVTSIATTLFYTLSLHDALPILGACKQRLEVRYQQGISLVNMLWNNADLAHHRILTKLM